MFRLDKLSVNLADAPHSTSTRGGLILSTTSGAGGAAGAGTVKSAVSRSFKKAQFKLPIPDVGRSADVVKVCVPGARLATGSTAVL